MRRCWLFVWAFFLSSLPVACLAQNAQPKIREFDIATLEKLAADMYAQDQEAWKATDALLALHPQAELMQEKTKGWLVEDRGGGDIVRFFRDSDGGLEPAYDISFPSSASPQVLPARDRTITTEEKAQFAARALALDNIAQRCSSNYNTIILRDPQSDGWLVWVMAATSDPAAVMMGIHYRFTISADGRKIMQQDALSRSCITMNKSGPKDANGRIAGIVVTQLVSEVPVETTLFLSLQHGMPIYVATPDRAIWKVEAGRLGKVRDPGPKAP